MKIRRAVIEQMIHYADVATSDGSYYGDKRNYLKRHEEILNFLKKLLEECGERK